MIMAVGGIIRGGMGGLLGEGLLGSQYYTRHH